MPIRNFGISAVPYDTVGTVPVRQVYKQELTISRTVPSQQT